MEHRLGRVLAVTTALFGASSLYLLWQLRRNDTCTETDLNAITTLRTEVERSEQARKRLEHQLTALRSSALAAAPVPGGGAGPIAAGSGRGVLPFPFKPPELTAEQRALLTRRRYRQLFRELALSPQQIDALLPVLAAQDQGEGPWHREPSRAERDQAEISGVLGTDKAAQFERLRKTLPARSHLSLVRMQLEEAGEPLSDEQRKQLLANLGARDSSPFPKPIEGEPPEQRFERFRAWQQERDQRLREDAAPILTPEQKKVLEEEAATQATMMGPLGGGAAGARAPR